ncbi:MAG TPA: phasin family protein [Usitatibacteraceae bacterium]|nr:phasin family protein [Usitatibacteraceae bacterium]
MARTTRTRKARSPAVTPAKAARTIRASAQKAFEAGVQAVSGVRQSAVGAFDALVKQGAALESRSRRSALAKAGKARDAACARAEEARAKTVEAVSHLERVFEKRVSNTISKLGVPTARDVRALSRQVAELQVSVDRLHRSRARAAR